MSDRGAFSDLLNSVLERIVLLARRRTRGLPARDVRVGVCVGRHGARDAPELPGSARARTTGSRSTADRCSRSTRTCVNASDAAGAAEFALACDRAGVPCSGTCIVRTCRGGSTIGPITASRDRSVDRGRRGAAACDALCRELMGARDVGCRRRPRGFPDAGAVALPVRSGRRARRCAVGAQRVGAPG